MNPPQFRAEREFQPDTTADTSAEASLRKRWIYLLPIVFVTYSLAYLDRANFGFGAAAGLASTLAHHQPRHLAARRAFLPWLFRLPDSGRDVGQEIQRPARRLRDADPVGMLRGTAPASSGSSGPAGARSTLARRRREPGVPGDAALC